MINPTDSFKTLKKCVVTRIAYEVVNFSDEGIRSDVSCSEMGARFSLVNQDDDGEERKSHTEQEQGTEHNI